MRLSFIFFCLLPIIGQGQIITTFAGNGTATGVTGDGGPATLAAINGANGGSFDKQGNYYVADIHGHRIRKVTPAGIISTITGTGASGYNGDNIPATSAQLDNPTALAVDTAGNVYIDDLNSYRIRRVDAASGVIRTIAGIGTGGYNGDNIPATSASLGAMQDICVDRSGNIYLADQGNFRVRKIDVTGTITTVAGSGAFSGTGPANGTLAKSGGFNFLSSVAVDKAGNVYIADRSACKIWKVDHLGVITTVAGNGNCIYSGDGIAATAAQINPMRITFDRSDRLVIGDYANHRIFRVNELGIMHCIAGSGATGFSGDGGPATAASFDFPAGVAYDTCGNLYIAESTNRRVRKVAFNPACIPISVNDVQKNANSLSIHPNPAYNELTVTSIEKMSSLCITNTVGQVVITAQYKGIEKAELDIRHLPAGVYMVQVIDVDGQKMNGKFVKEL